MAGAGRLKGGDQEKTDELVGRLQMAADRCNQIDLIRCRPQASYQAQKLLTILLAFLFAPCLPLLPLCPMILTR